MSHKVNTKKSFSLLVFVALLALVVYVLAKGVPIGVYDVGNLGEHVKYGLDLTGGVNVVLQAEGTDENGITEEKMESTVAAIKKRVDTMGVSEATVTKLGEDRIRVSIPSVTDQQQALDMIGKTAQLEFVGPDGEVILTGENVVESNAVSQQTSSGLEQPVVTLKFDEAGTKLFAEATQKFQNQQISIELDDEVISSPNVNAVISNGEAVIEGMGDADEANNLAELIRGGALPLKLETLSVNTIGPTLGQDSLQKSIMAGGLGILAVILFMLLVYRGFGIIADLALILYIIIDLVLMVLLNVTLTLPGIAGLILSVGMAVDANVIIFERIKDESRSGKSMNAAIDSGFKRAMSTIIDSNVTTLIAGFVLYFMGDGTVQGFAVTLVMGIFISMLTAIFVTRHLIKLVIGSNLLPNQGFFGM